MSGLSKTNTAKVNPAKKRGKLPAAAIPDALVIPGERFSWISTVKPYWQLMRFHKPVGTLLLLWPTLWAVMIASAGHPHWTMVLIFVTGVVLMRACGCVINDYADRHFDGHVARTKDRPLVNGSISPKQALLTFAVLALLALSLVLFLNRFTLLLACVALVLVTLYPYSKRYTYFPQVILGAAFAWAIPMAFAAIKEDLPPIVWLIYVSTLLWVLAYDTLYGMVDRAYDLRIGVKSTAILFGDADLFMVSAIHAAALLGLVMVGYRAELGHYYFSGLVLAALVVVWQMWIARKRQPEACFQAFQLNNYYGLVITAGLCLDYWLG